MLQTVCQGAYFSIVLDGQGVEYVCTGDEVLIVPLLDDQTVLLIREPSAAFGEQVLVLPGGEIAPGEAHAATADRELQEETGFRAGRLDFLGELQPFSKYLKVRSFVYLARDLIVSRLVGDEGYEIGVESVELTDVEKLFAAQRLFDARVIAALYLTRHFVATRGA